MARIGRLHKYWANPSGFYGVERLQELIQESTNAVDISLLVSKENCLINLTVGGNCEVLFTDGLLSLLGLDDGLGGEWLGVGIYTGDRPVNFVRSKLLRVHLEQVSTTDNALDGAPSTLLTTIGVECHAFGETVRIEHAEFKRLQAGTISELKVSVRDDDTGLQVINHLPISVTLEIVQAWVYSAPARPPAAVPPTQQVRSRTTSLNTQKRAMSMHRMPSASLRPATQCPVTFAWVETWCAASPLPSRLYIRVTRLWVGLKLWAW